MEKTGIFSEFRPAQSHEKLNILRQVSETLLVEWDDEVSDVGIDSDLRKEIVAHLYKAMADSHVLHLKTSRYYWNIKGPIAHGLKHMLKDQVREQIALQDGLGLRIRALSYEVPFSLLEFLELSDIRERGPIRTAEQMLRDLAAGHAHISKNLKNAFPVLERAADHATMNVLSHHIAFHETSMRQVLSCLQQEENAPWEGAESSPMGLPS